MDPYIRLGEPFTRAELDSLRFDGLLQAVTDDCFLPSSTALTPELRAGALGELPPGLAYSHGTAAWIWWGLPARRRELECSTLARRRVRAAPDRRLVHETSVPMTERSSPRGRTTTTRNRTLFDLLRSAVLAADPPAAWRERLAPLSDAESSGFLAYLDAPLGRPHVQAVRAFAGEALGAR